jgi:hypothetical protein
MFKHNHNEFICKECSKLQEKTKEFMRSVRAREHAELKADISAWKAQAAKMGQEREAALMKLDVITKVLATLRINITL